MGKTVKPLIRWAGSKRKLIPVLKKYWAFGFRRYIEPFAGSACLFFELAPDRAILADNNRDLINMYQAVKNNPLEVYQKTTELSVGKDSYYYIRSLDVDTLSYIERAARFIYLNRYCFNGLYRTNMKGHFNVPYSPSKTGGIPCLNSFESVSKALKHAKIISSDYSITLKEASLGDFVYIDPPYAVKNSRIFNQYGPETFGLNDLECLANSLDRLDNAGVKFVLSYANVEEAVSLFKEWKVHVVDIQRNIAGFSKFRRIEEEILVTNIDNDMGINNGTY